MANSRITRSAAIRHLPGEAGIWVFILGDLIVFSIFFIVFLYYREQNAPLFTSAQKTLNQPLGLTNTLLMLSSSWLVALGIKAARSNKGRWPAACFALAFGCGLGFVVVKVFEYGAKIRAGIGLGTNDFFMYYFMFTGIHLMHVLIGMSVLAVMSGYSRNAEFSATRVRNLESGASFWHLIDLLWIILFALLYLVK